MRLPRLLPGLALLLLIAVAPQAGAAAAPGDATAFMNDLGNRVIKIINDKATPDAQRRQQFRELVENAFDVAGIGRFVLGRYWRTATAEERQDFLKAFETYMLQVYWSRFSSYNGERFRVVGQQDQGNGTITVTTEILRPDTGEPPVKVSWSLVRHGDSFRIQDASLEGVSQALTYRDEFSSIMERNGGKVSALIDQLNERAKT